MNNEMPESRKDAHDDRIQMRTICETQGFFLIAFNRPSTLATNLSTVGGRGVG
jgi:hypothetical protein